MMALHSLITRLLARVPDEKWEVPATDVRILSVLNYIESHLEGTLSNPEQAGHVCPPMLFTGNLQGSWVFLPRNM